MDIHLNFGFVAKKQLLRKNKKNYEKIEIRRK
jgi:hypothetical protein